MKQIFTFLQLIIFLNVLSAQADSTLYSFFVAGHTYGQPGVNNVGVFPLFRAQFPYIQSRSEIKFGVFTGDIVSPNPTAQDWDEIDADIDSLGMPVYFAVGNHDMENRPLFESRYGDTYFSFKYENDLFIILDPNIDHWNISGDQLDFLRDVVDSNHEIVDNIFVFFHQVLWWSSDNIYSHVRLNSHAGRASTINFWSEVEPIFHQLSNHVVMFSGDIGAANWSDDFMYDKYDNIELISSGMGENSGDNFVVVNIATDKTINYDLICLNDTILECFGELTDYRITSEVDSNHSVVTKLYPNPTRNELTIEFEKSAENTLIQIFDIQGRLIIKQEIIGEIEHHFDMTEVHRGFYFVKISTSSKQEILSFVVQ